jgi:hypothetical protein
MHDKQKAIAVTLAYITSNEKGKYTSGIHAVVRAFGNLVVDEISIVVGLVGVDSLLLGLLCRPILGQIIHGI